MKARLLDARRLDTAHGHVRVAIVVPKFGFTAVRRNQLKRRLRELARTELVPRPASCDILLRVRRDAYAAPFAALRDDVAQLASALVA